jgi:hypothetical protein
MTAIQEHLARPWRVHRLADDFEVIDAWRMALRPVSGQGFEDFVDVFWKTMGDFAEHPLAKVRLWLGERLGWDAGPALSIPGCREKTVAERMPRLPDAAANLAAPSTPRYAPAGITDVYRYADEALYEFSNKTIHGVLHLGWINGEAAVAVYVKYRGLASRAYMAAIWPARHLLLYPQLVRTIEQRWTAHRA